MTDPVILTIAITAAFLAAFSVSCSSRHYRAKWWLTGFFALLGTQMLVGAMTTSGMTVSQPILRLTGALELGLGPLMLFYVRNLHSPVDINAKHLGHLTGPIIGVLLFNHPANAAVTFLILGGYLVWIVKVLLSEHRRDKKNSTDTLQRKKWITITVGLLALTFAMSIAQFFFDFLPHTATYVAVFPVFVLLLLYHFRYPSIFYDPREFGSKATADEKLAKIGLEQCSLPNLGAGLKAHLDKNQSHLNPELTLAVLAEELGMSAKQLSAVISTQQNRSFYEFIGAKRASYAMDLFKQDPEMNSTEVMHASGFKSKSTFYKAFREITGTTPTEFCKSLKK